VADDHELRLLMTHLLIADLGIGGRSSGAGLPSVLKLAMLSPVNQWGLGFLSDRGEDAGLPNLKEAFDEVMEYEPNLGLSYIGVGSEFSGQATLRFGDFFSNRDREIGLSIDRAWGKLTTPSGLTGDRVTLSGNAVAELSIAGFEISDRDTSAVIQVDSLRDLETRELSAVTAVVTTFGDDSVTTRTTTFDLTTEAGRTAARTVVDAAAAPVPSGAFFDGALESLELIAQDRDVEGLSQSVKTYALAADDYGAFFDVSFLGFEVNVNVTRLE